jgi:cell shape-determining protein MreC
MQVLIVILLAAILLTLLGAWGVIGWIIAVLLIINIFYFIFSGLRKAISNATSAIWELFDKVFYISKIQHKIETRRQVKDLKKLVKFRESKGYDAKEQKEQIKSLLENNT